MAGTMNLYIWPKFGLVMIAHGHAEAIRVAKERFDVTVRHGIDGYVCYPIGASIDEVKGWHFGSHCDPED